MAYLSFKKKESSLRKMLSAPWSRWHANVANLGSVNVCGWETAILME